MPLRGRRRWNLALSLKDDSSRFSSGNSLIIVEAFLQGEAFFSPGVFPSPESIRGFLFPVTEEVKVTGSLVELVYSPGFPPPALG